MKAISLKQPWASLIANGEKTIETRTWPTKYRGDLLICASKQPRLDRYPSGCALCIVTVIDWRPMTKADEQAACCELYQGAWSWLLSNIHPIVPFAVKGSLGFYEVALPVKETRLGQRALFE